jgi:hypothetical protein
MTTRVAAFTALTAVLLLGSAYMPAPARAANVAYSSSDARVLPFARSERAQSVWASGVCWSRCGSVTTWNLAACLERDSQGHCIKRADAADRACQRECRNSGGPLLPIDF